MNNKIISTTKTTTTRFLAIVLITGLITIVSVYGQPSNPPFVTKSELNDALADVVTQEDLEAALADVINSNNLYFIE